MPKNAIKLVAIYARNTLAIGFFVVISGCATRPNAHPQDPWESYNRGAATFNDHVDAVIAKPLATAYQKFVPHLIQTGVNNFFSNLTDPWTAINSVLQLKPQAAVETVFRFGVNTFLGFGGLFDIASEMRIEKHKADFGHTLGYWGVGPGPYLVIPFLGPSTFRDTLASTLIAKGDLVWQLEKVKQRNALYAFRLLDQRANVLRNSNVLEAVALDKYTFTRDIFLQIRQNEVFDGNPPEEALSPDDKADATGIPPPGTEEKPEPRYDLEPIQNEPTEAKPVEKQSLLLPEENPS
mgnify:CR=1 FL=1